MSGRDRRKGNTTRQGPVSLGRPTAKRTHQRAWIVVAVFACALGFAGYRFGGSNRARSLPPAIAVSPGAAAGFNVLLITLDTLRADHLGCYGYLGIETPVLDALATGGVRFADAVCTVPMTAPSHSTILTGHYPPRHGVRDNGTHRLVDEHRTLAEIFKAKGYATSAFIAAFVLDRRFGFNQGFDHYDDDITLRHRTPGVRRAMPQRPADAVTDSAIEWLREHQGTNPAQPFFTWIHCFDPHQPYRPPEPFKTRYASSAYDGEIAFVDQQIGRVMSALGELNLLDRTLIVVVADHGEGLGEHSESTHSLLIYDSTMRVPFIINAPAIIPGGRIVDDRVVSLVDVAPTILDLLGFDSIACDGVSLLRASTTPDRAVYMETLSPKLNHGWASLHGLRRHYDKYIEAPAPEYYDLTSDPAELNNLLAQRQNEAEELHERLAALMESFPDAMSAAMMTPDAEVIAKLAALGYVVGAPGQAAGPPRDPKVMMVTWGRRAGEVRQAIDQGRFKEAMPMIQQVLADTPQDARMWNLLALAQTELGLIDDAISSRMRTIRLQQDDPNHWIHLARLQQANGDPAAAQASLAAAEDIEPDHGEIYLVRAEWALKAGQYAEAITQCEEARKRDRTRHTATTWSLEGMVYEQMGDLEKAKAAYERAYEADVFDAKALLGLAKLAERAGEYERVVELATEILPGEPQWLESRPLLARAYVNIGRSDEAVWAMQEAVRAAPDNPRAHNNLANILFQASRLSEAIEVYKKAIVLEPDYTTAHFNLAVVYKKQGDVEEAIDHFARAAEIDPSMHRASLELARLHTGQGDLERAMAYLEKVLSSGAVGIEQIEADQTLQPLLEDARFEPFRNREGSP